MRVVTVSPGFIETDAATRMIERMAEKDKSDYTTARQQLMSMLGGIPLAGPTCRTKLRSSSPLLHPTGLLQSPEPNSSSTAERFQRFETEWKKIPPLPLWLDVLLKMLEQELANQAWRFAVRKVADFFKYHTTIACGEESLEAS